MALLTPVFHAVQMIRDKGLIPMAMEPVQCAISLRAILRRLLFAALLITSCTIIPDKAPPPQETKATNHNNLGIEQNSSSKEASFSEPGATLASDSPPLEIPTKLPTAKPTSTLRARDPDTNTESHPLPPLPMTIPPGMIAYETQAGDTLSAVAARFAVHIGEILCASPTLDRRCPRVTGNEPMDAIHPNRMSPQTLLPPGQFLIIPDRLANTGPTDQMLPDSEVVFSVSAANFKIESYLEKAGGFLQNHRQYLMLNGWNTGAEIVRMVAIENSINPRLLLALLEYQCGCVLSNPGTLEEIEPFMGATSNQYLRKDLYGQLDWTVHQLSNGYYGWRTGTLTEVQLKDGKIIRLDPSMNPGTAALQYFFALLYNENGWRKALDPDNGFLSVYKQMFGDPWSKEVILIQENTAQPPLLLPFQPESTWSFTGGPHPAFEGNGPLASLDFAPASAEEGCVPTETWAVAAADGLVVRSEYGLVVLDLDGDGLEQTGWNLMYLHIESQNRVEVGDNLEAGDPIGRPSCEGGVASGTHIHIARKLNGEWIPADSSLPFNLSGWIAHNGEKPYLGTLTRDGKVVIACTCSWEASWITMDE
jgi:murein DD-endopeptidase MepM/ murein hydrolase activator NlpD